MSINDHVLNILLTCFNNVVTFTEARTSESVRKHGDISSLIFFVTLQGFLTTAKVQAQ